MQSLAAAIALLFIASIASAAEPLREYRSSADVDLPAPSSRKVLGTWTLRPISKVACTRSFEQFAQKVYDVTRCDDSKDRNIGRELTHASATKFLSKQHAGDFYVILPNGDLSVRDSQGEVDVLTKHGGPASASVVAVKSSAKEGLEDAKTVYLDCYTVGYRFGFTGTRAMKGRPTDAAWDFVTPSRCQDNAENRRGIQAGTKAAW